MKALSLWQPWATLVAIQAKKIETRSWRTDQRGLLAIQATAFTQKQADLADTDPYRSALVAAGYFTEEAYNLPHGAIVAVVDLVGCYTTNDIPMHWDLSDQERAFGDYSPNRYAWLLENIRRLKTPVECGGHQQLWNVPEKIEAQIMEQL